MLAARAPGPVFCRDGLSSSAQVRLRVRVDGVLAAFRRHHPVVRVFCIYACTHVPFPLFLLVAPSTPPPTPTYLKPRNEPPLTSPSNKTQNLDRLPAGRVVPFFLIGRAHVLKDYRKKLLFSYPFQKGDVKWDADNSVRYPLLCSLAGLASGLFGIGGGMVKAPLLLEMGCLPAVQAATVATMILFTSGASTISLVLLDLMPHDYGACFFAFGLVATAIGAAAVRQVLTKHKKQSIIVLSVGIIISTSVVTMGIQSLLRLVADPKAIWKFGSLCGAGSGE